MVISKKRFLKRSCVSVITRHDLVVVVVYRRNIQLADRGHTAK